MIIIIATREKMCRVDFGFGYRGERWLSSLCSFVTTLVTTPTQLLPYYYYDSQCTLSHHDLAVAVAAIDSIGYDWFYWH